MEYKFGWIPDTPDTRDIYFQTPLTVPEVPYVDLRPVVDIPIWQQGKLGACTAFAVAFCDEFVMRKNLNKWQFSPSRLFIYYEERVAMGTTLVDSGAMIRDGMRVLNKIGTCPEYMWKYSDNNINYRIRPWPKCYQSAKLHRTTAYARVPQNEAAIKNVLVQGYPIAFGFMVYDSFMKVNSTGMVPMPDPQEHPLGGHAVVLVGYDNSKRVYICRNSWGSGWGDRGYFYLPYDYVHDNAYADDFWTIYNTN